MFRIVFVIICCYLLVRFIFGFVIPVVTAMLNVKKKMQEMQSEMGNPQQQASGTRSYTNRGQQKSPSSPSSSDYIEFEEVK